MAKYVGKTLIEVFLAEQEEICERLEKIKSIITRADRAKELVLIDDVDADAIHEICDWVQSRLSGRILQSEPPSMEALM